MTRKTRLALYRVRNHARRLVQAIDELGPEDAARIPAHPDRWMVSDAREKARYVARALTRILEDGDDA